MEKIANDMDREFACLMVGVPEDLQNNILQWSYANVPDAMVFAEPGKGRELKTHVTVKYGIHSDNPTDTMDVVNPIVPIPFTVGAVSLFTSKPDYDVMILPVSSELLVRLNREVSDALECTDTYPDYKPHMTIAYVKKGSAQHLVNATVVSPSVKFLFDSVIFSDSKSNKVEKKLTENNIFAK